MIQRYGVLGSGQVGQTLAKGLTTHGYQVMIGSRTPAKLAEFAKTSGIATGSFADVAQWAEGLVLAVAGKAALQALEEAGKANLKGKLVIDVTNPIADQPPEDGVIRFFTGPNDSLMERLQKAFPEARFVKAFSCVGAALMVDPSLKGGTPTMFICGDDAKARGTVAGILKDFGWEVEDMGAAAAARAIEPLCILWCIPGFARNEWMHAFKLVR
jgi:predicted dinucleotide-binding enzyme